MKIFLILILINVIILPIQSQIWKRVSTPYDYTLVYNLTKINSDIYVSKFNRDLGPNGNYANYKYSDGEWVRADNDTIYEVLGKPFSFAQYKNKVIVSCRNGIYLSIDSAKHWRQLPAPSIYGTHILDFDISQNGILAISEVGYKQTFRFDEANNEWEQIYENKNDTTKLFLIHQMESNSTLLFGLQQNIVNPWKSNDTLSGGIFISTDKGDSWTVTLKDSSLSTMFASDDVLLVSTKSGNILRSEDNGKTWSSENIGTVITNYSVDGDRLLCGSNPLGIIESRDNGKTWKVLSKSIVDGNIYKKDDKYFFKGFGRLVFEADSLFTEIIHTNLKEIYSRINRIYNNNDTLLATGDFKRGVQYSTDLGQNWNTYYPFLEEQQVKVYTITKKNNQIYLRAPYSLYSSTDYGKTFTFLPIFGIYSDLLILDDKILLYGKDGRLISYDNGKTFTPMDTTFIKNNYKIFKIAQTSNGDLLAFSTFNGVFKSSDNAETWTKLVDSLPNDTTFISIDKFYEFNGDYYVINYSPLRLLKSTNKGSSWNQVNIELFNSVIYFDIMMIDENTIILSSYKGEKLGLMLTTDQGKTWKNIDSEFPPLSDYLAFYNIVGRFNNHIYVETYYSGGYYSKSKLYRTTLEKLGITPTSVEAQTERNYLYTFPPYPNPAKSEVKVLFYWDINLPMSADDISIYNLDGKKIATQGNLRLDKQANHYGNIVWDCSTAEPGIYLISIKHGTEERTVKVVVE